MQKGPFRRPSASLAISLLALFVALGGTSYAAISLPDKSVGTAQLKNAAVTGGKIADGAVTPSKLSATGLTWTNATLKNGWFTGGVGDSVAGYAIDSAGVVHLRGSVFFGKRGTAAFTLPVHYRPRADVGFAVYEYETQRGKLIPSDGFVLISPAGVVKVYGTANYTVSLEGVTFSTAP